MCACKCTSIRQDKPLYGVAYVCSLFCVMALANQLHFTQLQHICHVSVCMKYNWSWRSKKEHCASWRTCVKPLAWKNLAKTEYVEETGPAVYLLLLIFNISTWYHGLASDGFFFLSNGWRILCHSLETKHFKINSVTQSDFFGISDGCFCQKWSFCSVVIHGKHPDNLSPVLSCPFCFVAVWQQCLPPRLQLNWHSWAEGIHFTFTVPSLKSTWCWAIYIIYHLSHDSKTTQGCLQHYPGWQENDFIFFFSVLLFPSHCLSWWKHFGRENHPTCLITFVRTLTKH